MTVVLEQLSVVRCQLSGMVSWQLAVAVGSWQWQLAVGSGSGSRQPSGHRSPFTDHPTAFLRAPACRQAGLRLSVQPIDHELCASVPSPGRSRCLLRLATKAESAKHGPW